MRGCKNVLIKLLFYSWWCNNNICTYSILKKKSVQCYSITGILKRYIYKKGISTTHRAAIKREENITFQREISKYVKNNIIVCSTDRRDEKIMAASA